MTTQDMRPALPRTSEDATQAIFKAKVRMELDIPLRGELTVGVD